MVELYACELPTRQASTERKDEIVALLPEHRRKHVLRFRRAEDTQRSALGELLVRSVIADTLGVSNERIQFEDGEHGKPLLRTPKEIQFSISHSGEWVLVAFSESTVGIDIQKIEMRSLEVARRFFTDEEYELILAEPDQDRVSLFYELWTLKESYLKALGVGLTGSLRSFAMHRDAQGFYAESNGKRLPFFFRQYELDPRYRLAVCAEEREFAEDVQILTLDQITSALKEGR